MTPHDAPTKLDGTPFRWWLWRQVIRLPKVCPARAHSIIVWSGWKDGRGERNITINRSCRQDCADNGACWCGKVRGTSGQGGSRG